MTDQEFQSVLSRNIKRYRKKLRLSQAALAEKLDISVNFLCNIENGNKWMSLPTLVKLATALEIEPYELFKPEDILPPDLSNILNRYADEAAKAVTETLNQLRGSYLPQAETSPKD
jgi:transcriptional regulator with XRE-family HTH domain